LHVADIDGGFPEMFDGGLLVMLDMAVDGQVDIINPGVKNRTVHFALSMKSSARENPALLFMG
jgi:hypothetical protein